jgi:hypothetical protein
MIKLTNILKELNVPKPEDAYPLKGPETNIVSQRLKIHKYRFVNRAGDDMTIEINFDIHSKEMYTGFYKTSEENATSDQQKYGHKTGSGDMIKVLATVVEAIKRTANLLGGMEKVYNIHIEPVDKKRFNIYKHYAKTLFPDFNVKTLGKWIVMINKNFKQEN